MVGLVGQHTLLQRRHLGQGHILRQIGRQKDLLSLFIEHSNAQTVAPRNLSDLVDECAHHILLAKFHSAPQLRGKKIRLLIGPLLNGSFYVFNKLRVVAPHDDGNHQHDAHCDHEGALEKEAPKRMDRGYLVRGGRHGDAPSALHRSA